MKRTSLGIIGVGHLGEIHTKIAAQSQQIDLIGIYDIDQERGQIVAEKYKTHLFPDLETLLKKVEAVSIVVPTENHYKTARTSLEHGCHLFIEKPITAKTQEAKSLIKMAKENQLKLQVGHIERFNPAFLSLQGYSLQPLFIESHRLSQFNPRGTDVSVILDLMIHDIDIVLNLIQSPLESIQACGVSVVSNSEDIANVRLSFANQAVANLTTSRISAKSMRKIRLFQRHAYVTIDFLQRESEIMTLQNESDWSFENTQRIQMSTIGVGEYQKNLIQEKPHHKDINSLQTELEGFVQAIENNSPVMVSGEEGLRALEVALIILDQIKRPQD